MKKLFRKIFNITKWDEVFPDYTIEFDYNDEGDYEYWLVVDAQRILKVYKHYFIGYHPAGGGYMSCYILSNFDHWTNDLPESKQDSLENWIIRKAEKLERQNEKEYMKEKKIKEKSAEKRLQGLRV